MNVKVVTTKKKEILNFKLNSLFITTQNLLI
jgi:hypothetical protein